MKLKFQALVSRMIGREVMERARQVLVCKIVDIRLTMLIGPPYMYLVQHIHESNGVISLLTHGAEEMVRYFCRYHLQQTCSHTIGECC